MNEAMKKAELTADNVMSFINGGVWILVAAAIVICGLMCVTGKEDSRAKAKDRFPWILGGAILIVGAKEIAMSIISTISF